MVGHVARLCSFALVTAVLLSFSAAPAVADQAPPELRVQYGAINGTAYDGVPVDAYASIENTGDPTPAESLVRFHIDDTWLGDATAPAGWEGIISLNSPQRWTPTPGWHTLRVQVDAGDAIAEQDETNNGFQWDFHVDAADAKPDLRVLDADFKAIPQEGTWVDVMATVESVGPPTTVDSFIAFYVDDTPLGMATLSAGFDGTAFAHSPEGWVAQPGTHVLKVVMDATGVEDESDESNNVFTRTYVVGDAGTAREAIYGWSYYPQAANAIETTTVTVPADYRSVWYDLKCDTSTVEVYLDGALMATCAHGVRTAVYPDTIGAGDHTFGVVYLGVGPATLQVSGVRLG
jgi:hypothetical protein